MTGMRHTMGGMTHIPIGMNGNDLLPATMATMSQWSESLVNRIAESVRVRRKKLGLTVQEVADRATALGHPMNRSTLSDLENGHRKDRLMIGDAVILAEVLDTPLAVLMFPQLPHGPVEISPGHTVQSIEAVKKISGLFETAHLGNGPDAHRSLAELSLELEDIRRELHEYSEKLEAVMMHVNDEDRRDQVPLYMKLVESYKAQERVIVREILSLGGVVNDG